MVWQAETLSTATATLTTPTPWTNAGQDGPGNASAGQGVIGAAPASRRRAPGRRLSDLLRDELLMVMSHDLMTPLMTLDGYIRLLREDAQAGNVEPKSLAKGLAAMERQVARLAEMAELVREYLGWEERTQELVREPTDLGALVGRVVEALRPTTRRHRIALALPPAPVVGHWDARRLAQVIQNVVGNAVKYSPDGGTVSVAVREAAGVGGPSGRRAIVCVRDQGMGLPPSAVPHLFDRGYRVAPDERDWSAGGDVEGAQGCRARHWSEGLGEATEGPRGGARRPDGSGLGLYLCQRIVQAHGGQIWAESAGAGKGSTFWVSLPYCGAEDAHRAGGAELRDGPA
jgi:signal transduction histidine kinase